MRQTLTTTVILLFILSSCSWFFGQSEPDVGEVVTIGSLDDGSGESLRSGLIMGSKEEYLKTETAKMARSFATGDEARYARLPPAADIAKNLPKPGRQGKQNSCASWAVGYALKSFQEARENGWELTPQTLFSPSFIYHQINGGKDKGASLADAMDFLIRSGTVPLDKMPYLEEDFSSQPSPDIINMAKGFRSLGYRRIDERDLNLIKSYLASEEPVLLAIEMFENFLAKGMKSSGDVYKEKKGRSLGYHSVVAVGYDDTKGALKILNSWGGIWADHGYGWIDYKFYPKVAARAYVVYDAPTPPEAVSIIAPDLKDKNTGPEKAKAGALNILIVPDEAGIEFSGKYLRLGDSMDDYKKFFSAENSNVFANYNYLGDDVVAAEDVLFPGRVGKFSANRGERTGLFTNRGVTFGTAKGVVRRIHGAPDAVDTSGADVYFYRPIASDWGGIDIIKHATLKINYDAGEKVNSITLANEFKETATGKGFAAKIEEGEQKIGAGQAVIKSPLGGISFAAPAELGNVEKSDWGALGIGYFLKPEVAGSDMIAVKIFNAKEAGSPDIAKKRLEADLASRPLPGNIVSSKRIAGEEWISATGTGGARFFLAKGGFIYQLELTTDTDVLAKPWAALFLSSVKFDH